jgi:hypothetical protein
MPYKTHLSYLTNIQCLYGSHTLPSLVYISSPHSPQINPLPPTTHTCSKDTCYPSSHFAYAGTAYP